MPENIRPKPHASLPAKASAKRRWVAPCADAGKVYFGCRVLSAYSASVVQRAFYVFSAIWVAVQAAFLHSQRLFDAWVWFGLALGCSCAVLILAGLLTLNRPKVSAVLQGVGIIMVFTSLAQGAYLKLPQPGFTWILPALGVLPALYVALKRNLQFFALLGYVCGLCTPLYLGILQNDPRILFLYYLGLAALLPLIAAITLWRLLNVLVFTWVFVVGAVFVHSQYQQGLYAATQGFFAAFAIIYTLTFLLRMRNTGFRLNNFPDFALAAGISLWAVLFQLRLVAWNDALLLEAIVFAALLFGLLSLCVNRLFGENGRVLGWIYGLICFCLGNLCLHMLIPGTLTLLALCLEAALLFAWSALKNMYVKKAAGGVILFVLIPCYFFSSGAQAALGAFCIGLSALVCAFSQNRESKRNGVRTDVHVWSSAQEVALLIWGFAWWFGGLAAFAFSGMPEPGLVFFALSSACACSFYAIGKVIRFRALREVIFLPLFISIPAVLLPFLYQAYLEWPDTSHWLSYNYLSGVGLLAWVAYFASLWAALYRNWGGLISNQRHAQFLGLVTLELLLVLTSSCRAFALESGVSPAFLSVLAVLPSLACILFLSYAVKHRKIYRPYRQIMVLLVPAVLFAVLAVWFMLSLSSLGGEAPGGKYVPLLNPVEFAQVACIVAFGYWQRRLRKARIPTPHLSAGRLYWVYGLWGFMWLHGLMFRVVQYFSQANVWNVFDFIELRFIFALIWVVFGIVAWLTATRLGSTFSWWCGAILFFTGSITLALISLQLWGRPMVVLLTLLGVTLLSLLFWLSPAPFTERGRKL